MKAVELWVQMNWSPSTASGAGQQKPKVGRTTYPALLSHGKAGIYNNICHGDVELAESTSRCRGSFVNHHHIDKPPCRANTIASSCSHCLKRQWSSLS